MLNSVFYRLAYLRCALLILGLFGAVTLHAHAQTVRPSAPTQADVSDYLQQQLATSPGPVSFLVILQEQIDAAALVDAAAVRAANQVDPGELLYQQLTATAQRTQAPLRRWLEAQGIPYRAFYLVNMVEVLGDAQVAEAIRSRPEVARLIANPTLKAQLAVSKRATTRRSTQLLAGTIPTATLPYGLNFTHAPDVWNMGYTGKGIIIGSQDTGVFWDHPALQLKYRGVVTATDPISGTVVATVTHPYNWFDAWGTRDRPTRCASDPQVPCDDNGHGTHTVGTMLGDATRDGGSILGMAPDAQWIGCRNMHSGVGTPASYTACFEFFLAPYPQNGDKMTEGKPALRPHLINNSWGCPPSEGCDVESLRQVVETVRAAGVMVVASNGNEGRSGCATTQTPIAIYDATFSTGAHDNLGKIADFSSRGPVTADNSRRLKPDLVAPGVGVRSTHLLPVKYTNLSGTSMASPHVAGAVALLWSAVPTLTREISLTEQILLKSATPVPDNRCDAAASTPISPNNTYGHGYLNVLAAVQMAQNPSTLAVRALDANGQPVSGALVQIYDRLTGYRYTAQSGADGIATLQVYAGAYRVQTTELLKFGETEVTVAAGETKQADLQEKRLLFMPVVGR